MSKSTNIKLRHFIQKIRDCKSTAEEREVVSKEAAAIRAEIRVKNKHSNDSRIVAKLLYMHMLGYQTHFGQMECVHLGSSQHFAEKRMGYLALMVLLDENQEVTTLITSSILKDLKSDNSYVQGLALCTLGNIASAEIATHTAGVVSGLIKNSNPYVKKKAILAAIRIIRKCPDVISTFVVYIPSLMAAKDHAILITGIALTLEMIQLRPKLREKCKRLIPLLVQQLNRLMEDNYKGIYEVVGTNDPFLQVKILQLLRILGKDDPKSYEKMGDVLTSLAINTENTQNPGNSILYECVKTIMSINAEKALKVLAVTILGRFLQNRDNNIRYVALNTLCHCVQTDKQEVQRHNKVIVKCLRDNDLSIRKRALDLIYALVNKGNVQVLVKELINYLSGTDVGYKITLTAKITEILSKYSPSEQYRIDTMIKIFCKAGNHTKDMVAYKFLSLVSNSKELRGYTVFRLLSCLKKYKTTQKALVNVCVWCIGEYGNKLVSQKGVDQANLFVGPKAPKFTKFTVKTVLGIMKNLIRSQNCDSITQGYLLNSLIKLSVRFPDSVDTIKPLLSSFLTNVKEELQQRASEYVHLIENVEMDKRKEILEVLPAMRKIKEKVKVNEFGEIEEEDKSDEGEADEPEGEEDIDEPEETTPPNEDTKGGFSVLDIFGGDDDVKEPAPKKEEAIDNGIGNVLDIFGTEEPQQNVVNNQEKVVNNNQNILSDPLDFIGVEDVGTNVPVVEKKKNWNGLVVFKENNLLVKANIAKPSSTSPNTVITLFYTNGTALPINNFEFAIRINKKIKFKLQKLESNLLPAKAEKTLIQKLELVNKEQIDLSIPWRMTFSFKGKQIKKLGEIKDLPCK